MIPWGPNTHRFESMLMLALILRSRLSASLSRLTPSPFLVGLEGLDADDGARAGARTGAGEGLPSGAVAAAVEGDVDALPFIANRSLSAMPAWLLVKPYRAPASMP